MHVIGSSPCPQVIGEVVIVNTSDELLEVQVLGDVGGAIETRSLETFGLQPGERRGVLIIFDCSVRQSFEGAVEVSVKGQTSKATIATKVPVTMEIISGN